MILFSRLRERYYLIFSYSGIILLGAGVIMLLPLLFLIAYPEENCNAMYFIIPALISMLTGTLMRGLNRNTKVTLTLNEGGLIIIVTWFFTVIFSALPFILSEQLNFTQAVFESVSGWTTTGLSVVDVTKTPKLFLIWRSIMQFFGGAGLAVVMLSAIIGPHGLGLYNAEGRTDKLLPNVKKSTKLIMTIYSGYVISGIILYILAGMPWFDAINHSIAAISTGGFSTEVNSIGAYKSITIEFITIILMFLGTINFAAHYILLRANFKKFIKLGEIKFMFFMLSVLIPLTMYLSLNNCYGSIEESFRVTCFNLISALSTTGFSTVGYENWSGFSFFVMIILMLIGGGTGSTAGGIKQYRVYLMIKSVYWNIKSFLLPRNSVRQDFIYKPEGKFYVNKNHIINTYNFIGLYLIFFIIGTLILTAYGFPLKDSLFEFASSIGTVGLSIGITSPDLPVPVLWTQIFGMILGRLEIFVIFYAFMKFIRDIGLIFKNV